MFINIPQTYLNDNREVFYNLGGDKIRNFMQPGKILVSSRSERTLEKSKEMWIQTEPELVQDLCWWKALDSLSGEEFGKLEFLVDFKSPLDFSEWKEFYFRILKINSQTIPIEQSDSYLKGFQDMEMECVDWFLLNMNDKHCFENSGIYQLRFSNQFLLNQDKTNKYTMDKNKIWNGRMACNHRSGFLQLKT